MRRQEKTFSKSQCNEPDVKLVSKNKETFETIRHNKLYSFENRLGRKSAIYFKRMYSVLHLQRIFVPLLSETDCLATKKLQSNALIMETSFFLIIIFCFQKVRLNLFSGNKLNLVRFSFRLYSQYFQEVSDVTCFKIMRRDGRKNLCLSPFQASLQLYLYIYIYIYILLTSWSGVLLEKLTSLQLVKKFPAFYGT